MICSICNSCFSEIDYEYDKEAWEHHLCRVCYHQLFVKDEEPSYEEFINKSDYKPSCFTFYKDKDEENNNLYCGIELEIQGYNRCNLIQDNLSNPFFYYKQDGSLDEDLGIEIVSHPATLKYHLNHWKGLFESLNDNGLNDINNCGLHFHFNKDAFTFNEIASLDYFINNSKQIIEDIGGRETNIRYANIIYKKLSSYGKSKEMYIDIFGHKRYYIFSRYHACNLSNKDTIELRFCKSTDDYNTFINRLKKVFALVIYCKLHNTLCEDIVKSQNDFIEYMNNYIKE